MVAQAAVVQEKEQVTGSKDIKAGYIDWLSCI